MSKALPNQTVAQTFILWRVPASMPISRETLLLNVIRDIDDSREELGFDFFKYSRRASPTRTIKFLLQRGLLSESCGLIQRTKNTAVYISKLPGRVTELIDRLPVSDPLILLAGASTDVNK